MFKTTDKLKLTIRTHRTLHLEMSLIDLLLEKGWHALDALRSDVMNKCDGNDCDRLIKVARRCRFCLTVVSGIVQRPIETVETLGYLNQKLPPELSCEIYARVLC